MCALGIAAGAGQGYMSTAGGTAILDPYAIGAVIGGVGSAINY